MTNEDVENFENAKVCHICNSELEKDNKVRDHDHYTGQYRGAACNKCNLNLNLPKFVPICIHNLKYDSKLFLRWILKFRNIYEKNKKKEVNIIPNTKENYITFSVKVVVDQYKQRNNYSNVKPNIKIKL
jgi:hypothetical protein